LCIRRDVSTVSGRIIKVAQSGALERDQKNRRAPGIESLPRSLRSAAAATSAERCTTRTAEHGRDAQSRAFARIRAPAQAILMIPRKGRELKREKKKKKKKKKPKRREKKKKKKERKKRGEKKRKKKGRRTRENESQVRLPCEVPAKSGVCKPWPNPGNFTIVTRSNGSVARAQGLDNGLYAVSQLTVKETRGQRRSAPRGKEARKVLDGADAPSLLVSNRREGNRGLESAQSGAATAPRRGFAFADDDQPLSASEGEKRTRPVSMVGNPRESRGKTETGETSPGRESLSRARVFESKTEGGAGGGGAPGRENWSVRTGPGEGRARATYLIAACGRW